jgi:uncharacterized repeat protein (TIGR03803 family)
MVYMFRHVLGAFAAFTLSIGSAGAASFTTLYSVMGSSDGNSPSALIDVGGSFYGTTFGGGTSGYGTVFSFNQATGAETVRYSFGGGLDGYFPSAALLNVGGILYGTTWYGGTANYGTVFSFNPETGAKTVLYSFSGHGDGGNPSVLISVGGLLYGCATSGGTSGDGIVFSINPATGAETVLHSFAGGADGASPYAALLSDRGRLYGTTSSGGRFGDGTVFSIKPATGAERVIYSFEGNSNGSFPTSALIKVGGTLYGSTLYGGIGSGTEGDGTLYSIHPATGAHTVLYAFMGGSDGDGPISGLISDGGVLYGTTGSGGGGNNGTLYSFNLVKGSETVVYSFAGGIDGSEPNAVIRVGHTLYGATGSGGTGSAGTLFSVNPSTGVETVLYSFTGASVRSSRNALQNMNGTLFLSSSRGGIPNLGDIVEINPSTGAANEIYAFTDQAAGVYPEAALIDFGSAIYGTTEGGGNENCSGGCGTVFSFNPRTGAETALYSFAGGSDGIGPEAALIGLNSTLYGTTPTGGTHGQGSVFSIDTATGAETVLHSFAGSKAGDGATPNAELITVGGTLYGTTFYGGIGCTKHPSGCGTIFSINPATGAETVLYSFRENDGSYPQAALTDVGGIFYGTTSAGGRSNLGTVFSFNPATGAEEVVHKFGVGTDGTAPQAALIDVGGTLYGTTSKGGTSAEGIVFSINPVKKDAETVLYNFTGGSDGGAPNGALVSIGNALYGTTSSGGAAQRGTVFQVVPN